MHKILVCGSLKYILLFCLASGGWILPENLWSQTEDGNDVKAPFSFSTDPGKTLDVLAKGRPLARFVFQNHDDSTEETHYQTYKPFHQIYAPDDPNLLLTSGVVPLGEPVKFPHHRGLFLGFNRITFAGQKADIWHCTEGVYSNCEMITIPVGVGGETDRATHVADIGWFGKDGKKFIQETRTVTVYDLADGTQLDWSTELNSLVGQVRLDGDPQHAGFHFRANQQVAFEGEHETYYVRPDGVGKKGETRNWDPEQKDPATVNLPWSAVSFVLEEKRYTVLRMSHPANQVETRGSERTYGRFGDYFEHDLKVDQPLRLSYRIWATVGELTVAQCEAKFREFSE